MKKVVEESVTIVLNFISRMLLVGKLLGLEIIRDLFFHMNLAIRIDMLDF